MGSPDLDRELLLSVAGGLGSRVRNSAGEAQYVRSDDCHGTKLQLLQLTRSSLDKALTKRFACFYQTVFKTCKDF